MAISLETIRSDLERLGVQSGDVLLVRANLAKLGRLGKQRHQLLQTFLDALGPEGTLIGLTFTDNWPINKCSPEKAFHPQAPSNVGALANMFLNDPRHIRSNHPLCSFAAIGPAAEHICADHGPDAPSYLPIRKLIDLDGKFLVAGCTTTSPGFTSVHWVQHELGLDKRSLMVNRRGTYYRDGDEVRLFRCTEIGGCSLGFAKFYNHYLTEEKLQAGYIGNAYSLLINAADAYRIEHRLLQANPRLALCDNPLCFTCRASWLFNCRDMPGFYVRKLTQKMFDLLRKRRWMPAEKMSTAK